MRSNRTVLNKEVVESGGGRLVQVAKKKTRRILLWNVSF